MLDINCRNADGFTPLLLVTRDVDLFEKSEYMNIFTIILIIPMINGAKWYNRVWEKVVEIEEDLVGLLYSE